MTKPVVVVTGSSGAGTSFVKKAFERIFKEYSLTPAIIEGDSFHKYERLEMRKKIKESKLKGGRPLTHFSEHANEFHKLENLFKTYKETGKGERRYYIHTEKEAEEINERLETKLKPGQFSPWEPLPENTDLLFLEGLHGLVRKKGSYDVAQYVDLGVGVVPVVNIEWMQKIYRDTAERGYSVQEVRDTIFERMEDYVDYILPQFDLSHINFHRVPLIDTSNPVHAERKFAYMPPSPQDSLVVTSFRVNIGLNEIVNKIPSAFMQNDRTIVYNGQHMVEAMDAILTPMIKNLINKNRIT